MTTSRRSALATLGAAPLLVARRGQAAAYAAKDDRIQIAAYYFPNYHVDPRNEAAHGPGWTEWELVKRAEPRFEGHVQPKVPLWGYEDESDPRVFAHKIAAAADHRIDAFIFDWYHYDDGPFLNRGLEQGYLRAGNHHRLKFALMWANHDWKDIHPAKAKSPPHLLYPGGVTAKTFDAMTDHIVQDYFRQPTYWRVEGGLYFSIYDLASLLKGLGGVAQTRQAMDAFREKTRKAGLGALHLNAVMWGRPILSGEETIKSPNDLLAALGFDSVGSYVWIHHVNLPQFPATDYRWVADQSAAYWQKATDTFKLPYHPNVSMGWDASPRCLPSDKLQNLGYPFMATIKGNTPAEFRRALGLARDFLMRRPGPRRILTINSWNEWTEGSYLEPDTVNKTAYLEAIRDTFPS